jgi:uncharacterized protein YqfA (UPF0365 family)
MYVNGGGASNYINNYSGAQGVGNLRFNTTNQNMEVWDGTTWQILSMSYATVGLNSEAESLLDWAKQKREEEMAWKELAEKNQAVKIALEKVEQAKQQLNITAKLARDYETTS